MESRELLLIYVRVLHRSLAIDFKNEGANIYIELELPAEEKRHEKKKEVAMEVFRRMDFFADVGNTICNNIFFIFVLLPQDCLEHY